MGGKLLARLRELEAHEIVGNVRGLGLLAGVELVRDRQSKASFDASLGAARKVWQAALAEGVIVRPVSGDVIALSPPFVITEKQIDRMVSVLDRAIAGVARELSG